MSFQVDTINGEQIIVQQSSVTGLQALTSFGSVLGWTNQKIYFLQKPLELNDSISWNSEEEILVLANDFSNTNYGYALKITGSNASVTIGTSLGQNRDGSEKYPRGLGLVLGYDFNTGSPVSRTTTPGSIVEQGATLVVNGSEVQLASPIKIDASANSVHFNQTIITDITSYVGSKQTVLNEASSDKLTYTNAVFNAKKYAIRIMNVQGIDNFSGVLENAFIQPHRSEDGNSISSSPVVKKNISFSKNFNSYDVQFVGNSTIANRNQAVELINVDRLPSIDIPAVADPNGGANKSAVNHVAIFQEIAVQAKNISGSALENCKIRIAVFGGSNRVNTDIGGQFQADKDFTSTIYTQYDATLDNSQNTSAEFTVLTGRAWNDSFTLQASPLEYDLYFESQDYTGAVVLHVDFMAYGFQLEREPVSFLKSSQIELAKRIPTNLLITQQTASIVSAYPINVSVSYAYTVPRITLTGVGGVQSLTPLMAYDLLALYQFENNLWSNNKTTIVNRIGNLLIAGDYDVYLESVNYTGDMFTDTEIVVDANSTFIGTKTDKNGTESTRVFEITNLVVNSRMLIFNQTTNSEYVNTTVNATTYTLVYIEEQGISSGDTIKVQLIKEDKEEFTTILIANDIGINALANQVDDQIYIDFNIDGSLVTKFEADYINNEIDLVIGEDWEMSEMYAWWKYNLATEDGIRYFFGGITAEDKANFRINTTIVDLFLDNRTTASYKQTDNRRFYRDVGNGYPVKPETTSGYGLDVVWRDKILVSEQPKIDKMHDMFVGNVFQTATDIQVKKIDTGEVLYEKSYDQDASGNVSLTEKTG